MNKWGIHLVYKENLSVNKKKFYKSKFHFTDHHKHPKQ